VAALGRRRRGLRWRRAAALASKLDLELGGSDDEGDWPGRERENDYEHNHSNRETGRRPTMVSTGRRRGSNSDEVAKRLRGSLTQTQGLGVHLTFLRSSWSASRRRRGDETAERRRRGSARVRVWAARRTGGLGLVGGNSGARRLLK
jgi:hypothetical protein